MASIGTSYKIKKINKSEFKPRLEELGFIPHEIIKIIKISPLKDTYLIAVRGTTIALKRTHASTIELEEVKSEVVRNG